ncbi:putative fibrinogen C domain-containing protein 1-like [Scophthalmus maximus]|uniref:Putative fibrinogen C domain-containing protein 1-like n=1 Tax=Scophthalmus maximus TaxID=52904 RepID=A0A2U9CAH0_SCOMX|nr:putative fibrinogen C domain-containing protein 1-like [Scophthalmus maximus]
MYGTSTANQRIKSWWSFFRKQRTQFWIEVFSDLRKGHLFNGTHEHKYVFLDILEKELDEYKQLWNNHTIRPVRQSRCPSGKPETMYHLAHRFVFNPCDVTMFSKYQIAFSLMFVGRECGFPVPQKALHQFDGILPGQHSLGGDDNLKIRFADLERQSALVPPVNWTTAVQNDISLKNMSLL